MHDGDHAEVVKEGVGEEVHGEKRRLARQDADREVASVRDDTQVFLSHDHSFHNYRILVTSSRIQFFELLSRAENN